MLRYRVYVLSVANTSTNTHSHTPTRPHNQTYTLQRHPQRNCIHSFCLQQGIQKDGDFLSIITARQKRSLAKLPYFAVKSSTPCCLSTKLNNTNVYLSRAKTRCLSIALHALMAGYAFHIKWMEINTVLINSCL